jgi:enterochelin esterase family protein
LSPVKAGRNFWTYQQAFPLDAYIEYAFIDGDKRLLDQFNSRITPNGMGDFNNFIYMPRAAPNRVAFRQRGVPRGRLTRHSLPTWHIVAGEHRTVHLYQPASTEPCPLLLVYDGNDFVHRGKLAVIVDNLIHQKRIRPIAMALVANSRQARMAEYACSEATLGFTTHAVLPLAEQHLNLIDPSSSPSPHAVLGASMGGLMALFSAIRLPQYFGSVISLSGSFSLIGRDSLVFDLVEKGELKPMKIWMDAGMYDIQTLLDSNRRIYPILAARGHAVRYREYPAGHNYPAWRDEVWRGLEAIFEPKLA